LTKELELKLASANLKIQQIQSDLKLESRKTNVARKQSIVNLNSQNFGHSMTLTRGIPIVAHPINEEVEFVNKWTSGLRKTNSKFLTQAIEEHKRTSNTSEEDKKYLVSYGATDISKLYYQDEEPAYKSGDSDMSLHSSDTDSEDEESDEEKKVPR
jgi:hypothetical protein